MPTRKKLKPAHSASSGGARTGASAALEGRKAPDFELPDREGKPVALKELIGKHNLVLYFYPKDMTPGCTTEACSFRDNFDRIRAMGARVVGVSADPAPSHQKFTDKYALNFPLLSDAGNRVGRLYGVYKLKSLYGREFMGIERTTFVIDRDGVVRKVFPKVRVNGHTDAVMDSLETLR